MQSASSDRKARSVALPILPIVALISVNALWGLSFPVVKSLNEWMGIHFQVSEVNETSAFRILASSWMVAARFTLAFVLISLLWNRLTRNATRQEWIAGAVIAIFFYLGLTMQVIGLATIEASRSGFLTSLTAVFTPVISTLAYRRLPSRFTIIGALIAVLGVAVLTGMIEVDGRGIRLATDSLERWTMGDTWTTLGSFLFSFQVLLLDYYGRRLNSAAVTPSMFLTTALLGWITVAIILATPIREWTQVPNANLYQFTALTFDPVYFGSLIALAFFCSLLSFGWMNQFQPSVSATQAAVIYSLEPVFASAFALFLPGWLSTMTGIPHSNEVMTPHLWVGGIMILVANVVALYPSKTVTHGLAERVASP